MHVMRQRTKRRLFACLWVSFIFVSCLWLFSTFRGERRNSRLPRLRSPEEIVLKVFVVEEHQEVLLAWTDAFVSGVLPPNSTLLHIDAHGDDGLPAILPTFPNFRPPRSELEVNSMIQENDRFIRAAQLTQMLKRFVWIYPFWATTERLYSSKEMAFGHTILRGQRTSCECDLEPNTTCRALDEGSMSATSEPSDDPLTEIPARLCVIHQRALTEVLRDVYARTRLPADSGWLGNAPLVLDIDEDFFGVRLVGSQLLGAGLRWPDVMKVTEAITAIFCPKDPSHEQIVDRWFFGVVEAMRAGCSGGTRQRWCSDARAALTRFFRPLKPELFCRGEKALAVDFTGQRAFVAMWEVLRVLNNDQLLGLRRAGICLRQSMRSLGVPKLHLCIGSNVPNESAVTEHYPSASELDQQFERMQAILTALPSRPRLITVARSARDGYVPRDLQAHIEQRLLAVLREVFKLKDEDFVFDEILLNGKRGDWYNRHYDK